MASRIDDAAHDGQYSPPQALFQRRVAGYAAIRRVGAQGLLESEPPTLDVECFLVAEMVIGGSRVGLGHAANRGDGGTPKSGLTTRFSLDISQYKSSFSRIVDVLTCN